MIVTDTFGIDEQVRRELPQKPAPRCIGKSGVRAELSKLPHHCRLAKQRRVQAANHFEKKSIRIVSAVNFGRYRGSLIVLGGFNQRAIVEPIEKQNSSQTGLPLKPVENHGHLTYRFAAKVDDDQLV